MSTNMRKRVNFDHFWGSYWPTPEQLRPYFVNPPGQEWFYTGGNDSAGLALEGLNSTQHLEYGHGRIDIRLKMWGNPDHGVFLMYRRIDAPPNGRVMYSKGDLTRLKDYVRSLHDTPLPIGLFIPFAKAWPAVKEFMTTEGQLPKSIDWISIEDIPDHTFPDPWEI